MKMKRVQSTCNYCALDCNMDFYVEDGRIVKVLPTKGYPVNDGFCCIKGLSLDKQQTVVKTSPLPKIRQADGTMKEVSWDEGFKHVADKLTALQEKYGRESVAGISTGQLTMEEFAIFGHVMRNYLKTNVDGNTRLCMATAVVAHKQSYGFDAPGYTLKDLELSDTIVFVGANPVVAHPILWRRVKLNPDPNKKVIVIDPRESETAMNADYWYPVRWKGDLCPVSYTHLQEAGNMVCVRMRQEPVTARAVPVSAQVEGAPYLSALLKKYSQDVSALYRLALNHKK